MFIKVYSQRSKYTHLEVSDMTDRVEDKEGSLIKEGDTVFTKIRGGKREGEASFVSCWIC
jgi:hypothetical protein